MKAPSFKKVFIGEMKGWLREDIVPLLPHSFFEDPMRFMGNGGGRIIGESRWRWRALLPLSNGRNLFLKMDRTKGWVEYLKYLLFPSKGRKEWFVAYQMKKRNLPVPGPLGWLERIHHGLVKESYYLSEAIESGVSLAERLDLLKDEKVLLNLVKTIVRMHQSGLDHKDFHAGNLLWNGESFFLTDLHRAQVIKSLSLQQRLGSLAHLFHSLRPIWERKDQMKFMEAYFEGDSIHSQRQERYLKKIDCWMHHLQRRQWKSRTRRCLKESTEFSIQKEKRLTSYHRRDFPFDRLKRAVKKHLTIVQQTPALLVKQSPEVKVSILNEGGSRICVKQFCYPRWWDRIRERFRHSSGLKAWLGGNGLRVRGIPSIKPLALIEQKGPLSQTDSFFIMEAPADEEEMDRFLCREFCGIWEKRAFVKAFAHWLATLHAKGIYHLDMKACNLLVLKEDRGWSFKLLDLEDLRLDQRVDEKRLFKNLLQLNTSIPERMTRTDRLRFFKEYQRLHPIIKKERPFLQGLLQQSKKRGNVYISPNGLVVERPC